MMNNVEERLYYAIDSDDPRLISKLLDEGMPVNTMFHGVAPWTVWSALHLCCEKGRLECARVLLDANASVNFTDKWNLSPLMYAIPAEWIDMVELLLKYGAKTDTSDSKGLKPLHLSVKCEDETCLALLVDGGAHLEGRDLLGRTALWHAAAEDGHLANLVKLLSLGACTDTMDKDEYTPLQAALWYADSDREAYTKALLDGGACVNPHDPNESIPQPSLLMMLVLRSWEIGEDLSEEELGLGRLLLAHGCDPDHFMHKTHRSSAKYPQQNGTTLMIASHRGAVTMVALLLAAGADTDIQDGDGLTALHMAVQHNHFACVQLLLSAKCQLNLTASVYIDTELKHGVTAFYYALLCGHLQAAQLIIDTGYNLQYEHYLWSSNVGTENNQLMDIDPVENEPTEVTNIVAVNLQRVTKCLCIENSRFLDWTLNSLISGVPVHLLSLCRRVIRAEMSLFNPRFVVDALPLPYALKEYISITGSVNDVLDKCKVFKNR